MLMRTLIPFLLLVFSSYAVAGAIHQAIDAKGKDRSYRFVEAMVGVTAEELNQKDDSQERTPLELATLRAAKDEIRVILSHPRLIWNARIKDDLLASLEFSPCAYRDYAEEEILEMSDNGRRGYLEKALGEFTEQEMKAFVEAIEARSYKDVLGALLEKRIPNQKGTPFLVAKRLEVVKSTALLHGGFEVLRLLMATSEHPWTAKLPEHERMIYLASRAENSWIVEEAHLTVVLESLFSAAKTQTDLLAYLREDVPSVQELRQFIEQRQTLREFKNSLSALDYTSYGCTEADVSDGKTKPCEQAIADVLANIADLVQKNTEGRLTPFRRLFLGLHYVFRLANPAAQPEEISNSVLHVFFLRVINPVLVTANNSTAIFFSRCFQRLLSNNTNAPTAFKKLKKFFAGSTTRGKRAHESLARIAHDLAGTSSGR